MTDVLGAAGGLDGAAEVEGEGDRITGVTFFLDRARFFPPFGLPPRPAP